VLPAGVRAFAQFYRLAEVWPAASRARYQALTTPA
jgi:hypothetical protein